MTTLDPRNITDAERPYLGMTPSQTAAVARQLLKSQPQSLVTGLIGWLGLVTAGIADTVSRPSKARYRAVLRDLQPTVPAPTPSERRISARSQAGSARTAVAMAGAAAGSAVVALSGAHTAVSAALHALAPIMPNDVTDELRAA